MNTQEFIQSSFLVWENVANLPIPEETKQVLASYKLDEFIWQAFGLPVPFAKYVMNSGVDLYIEALPDGETKIEKIDFTGEVKMLGYFVDEKRIGDFNYLLTFKIILLHGKVMEVSLERIDKQEMEVFDKAFAAFKKQFDKNNKKFHSWWFKWLYIPWTYIVKAVFWLPLQITFRLHQLLVFLFKKMIPF